MLYAHLGPLCPASVPLRQLPPRLLSFPSRLLFLNCLRSLLPHQVRGKLAVCVPSQPQSCGEGDLEFPDELLGVPS